jgi:hypothetical protein
MKVLKIISHPVLVMSFFLLILISGEHFGGFYLIYILLGLPNNAIHAFIALFGILIMFFGYKLKKDKFSLYRSLLYIIGSVLMFYALYFFFYESAGYNDSTFEQAIPLITLCVFSLSAVLNIVFAIRTGIKFFIDRNTMNNPI